MDSRFDQYSGPRRGYIPGTRRMHSYLYDNVTWYRDWHQHPFRIPVHVLTSIISGVIAAVTVAALMQAPSQAAAGILDQFPFQGRLTNADGTVVADSAYDVVFSLYTVDTGGVATWTESHTGANQVSTTDGIFDVMLGSLTALSGVDFNTDTWYLGVKVGTDSEMTPRIRLGAAPYAFNADQVDGYEGTDFLITAGLAGGQIAYGGTAASENLVLRSTTNGTKGDLLLVDDGGNVGIGTASIDASLDVVASANQDAIQVSGYSQTGTNSNNLLDLSGTWNTTGVPTAILLNITDTASSATSQLLDLQVGSSSKFNVWKNGTAKFTSLMNGLSPTTSAFEIAPTWNNGAYSYNGILLNVTDTASTVSAQLLDLQVGSSSKFNVWKNGTAKFTSLMNGANPTTSAFEIAPTWNNGAYSYNGILLNVTDTASSLVSKLIDLQVGGSSLFSVDKDADVVVGSAGSGQITVPGTALESEQFGVSASATGIRSLAVGPSASATGSGGIAIGYNSSAGAGVTVGNSASTIYTANVAVGSSASVTGDVGTAIGSSATAAFRGTALGSSANAGVQAATAIGYNAQASAANVTLLGDSTSGSGASAIAIGLGASGTAGYTVAIGQSALASGVYSYAIGQGATASATAAIAIGFNTTSDQANTMVVGGPNNNSQIIAAYFGRDRTNATPPANFLLSTTGGSGTDLAGTNFILAGGRGTGTGAGGDLLFQTATPGLTGTTLNSLTTRLTVDDVGNIVAGTGALATSATDGFYYLAGMPGTPTGTATGYSGRYPITWDSTNDTFYIYDAGWIAIGGSGGAFGSGSAGQATFWSGSNTIAGDNSFWWDNTAKELGIGTTTPDATLEVLDATGAQLRLTNNDAVDYADFQVNASGDLTITASGGDAIFGSAGSMNLSVPGSGLGSEQLGVSSSATGTDSLAIGNSASGSASSTVAVGASASATGIGGTSVGNGATTSVGVSIGVGTSSASGVALGFGASSLGTGIAIGYDSSTTGNSVAIGREASSDAANEVVFGSALIPLFNYYFGEGKVSTSPPANVLFNATGGSGTNIAAADLVLAGGRGTGTGAGGHLLFQVAPAGTTGSTLNSLITGLEITDTKTAQFGSTSNPFTLSVPGSGVNSEQFGAGASAGANSSTAVGASASAAGAESTSLGYSSSASGNQSTALGHAASAIFRSTTIGDTAIASGQDSVVVGTDATSTQSGGIAIGEGASVTGVEGIAIGQDSSASAQNSIALGDDAVAGTVGDFVIGADAAAVYNIYFGEGKTSATPIPAAYLHSTGGLGTDINATDLVLAGGRGTGTGAGGELLFQTATPGLTGSTLNSLTTRMTITDDGLVGIGVAPTNFLLETAGSIGPSADDNYDLGSSSFRWRDLYLGPTSLHITSKAAETTTARDWKVSIIETAGGAQGNLRIMEGANEYLSVSTAGKVGIGIATANKSLEVLNAADYQLRLTQTDGVDYADIGVNASGNLTVAPSGGNTTFNSTVFTYRDTATIETDLGVVRDNGQADLSVKSYSATATDGGILVLGRGRGTVGAKSIVLNGDQAGELRFQAYDGTDFESYPAAIVAEIDGTPGLNDMPGRLLFQTTPDGSAGATTRLTIDNAGNSIFGTGALATTATSGFVYTPGMAGTPTGVPTSYTGRFPLAFDSSNNKLYAYNAGWQDLSGSGGITGSGAAGRVTYWTGASTVASDAEYLWDATNNRLSLGSSPAVTGTIAIPNNGSIIARNVANSADILVIGLDGNDYIQYGTGNFNLPNGATTNYNFRNSWAGSSTWVADVNVEGALKVYNTDEYAANVASSGVIRLANTAGILWRNSTNTADIGLGLNANNQIEYGTGTFVFTNNGDADVSFRNNWGGFLDNFAVEGALKIYNSNDFASSVATTGALRVPNNQYLVWRNGTNTGDVVGIGINPDNYLALGVNTLTYTPGTNSDFWFKNNSLGQTNNFNVEGALKVYNSDEFGSNVAASGAIRLPNNNTINWRNAANSADVAGFWLNGSDNWDISNDGSGNVDLVSGYGSNISYRIFHENTALRSDLEVEGSLEVSNGTQFGNVATSGAIRIPNNQSINWRNAANTADAAGWWYNSSDNWQIGADASGYVDLVTGFASNANFRIFHENPALNAGLMVEGPLEVHNAAAFGNVAQSGAIRLANNQSINARNAANTADIGLLSLNTSNVIQIGAAGVSTLAGAGALGTTATAGFLYFSQTSGIPTGVPTSFTGQVPITWDATNNNLYVYEGGWNQVGGGITGSGASGQVTYWNGTSSVTGSSLFTWSGSALTVTGNIVPGTDDTYDLGTSSARWRDLYLGPSSLHLVSKAAETTTARDWKLHIQETAGATQGDLRILEGANEYFSITKAGNIKVGTVGSTNTKLYVSGQTSGATGQYGVYVGQTCDSGATAGCSAIVTQPQTEAAVFSTTSIIGLQVANASIGAGNSVTNQMGVYVNALSGATNNYAVYTAGTTQSYFGGNVGVGTTGPDRKLDILDASNPQLRLTQADATSYSDFQVDASGYLTMTNTGGRLYIGSESLPVTSLYLGEGITSTTPSNAGISATSGSGTDIAGGSLQINAGRGTGTGAGGDILFKTAAPGITGSALNSLVTRMAVTDNGQVGIGTGAPNATLDVESGTLDSTTESVSLKVASTWNDSGTSFNGLLVSVTDTASASTSRLLTLRADGSTVLSVDSTGRMSIGRSSATTESDIGINRDGGSGSIGIASFNSTASDSSEVRLVSARGTEASPLIVNDGDTYGVIRFQGFEDSNPLNQQTAAMIIAAVDGTPGAVTDMPGELLFQTTPDGSGTPVTRMSISQDGKVGIGNGLIDPTGALLEVRDTSVAQLRVAYDASNYADLQTSSGGDLTITPSGGDLNVVANLETDLLGLGGAVSTSQRVRVVGNLTSGTAQYGINMSPTWSSSATSTATGFYSAPSTEAAAFTMTSLTHFRANNVSIGAGSSITSQYGLYVAGLTGATNNYAIYTDGTTQSYFGGNVGIGTTSPQEELHVHAPSDADSALLLTTSTTGTTASDGLYVGIQDSTKTGYAWNYENAGLIVGTNNTARLTIDATGNLVPGTGALLTTATDGFIYSPGMPGTPTGVPTSYTGRVPLTYDTTNHKLYAYDDAGGGPGAMWREVGGSGGGLTGSGAAGQVSFWTGTSSQSGDNGFYWNNTNKNLGIGTTSPNANSELHIKTASSGLTTFNTSYDDVILEGSGDIGITFAGTATSSNWLAFTDINTTYRGAIQYAHSSDSLIFWASGSTVGYFNSTGLNLTNGLTLGNSSSTTNGTIRYTGTDIEGRVGGVWTSLTGAGSSSFDGALVYMTSNMSATGWNAVNFAGENYDTNNYHNPVTNNSRLTVPSGVSKVKLCFNITFTAAVTIRQLQIRKDGSTTIPPGLPDINNDGNYYNACSAPISVSATNYFEVWYNSGSGGPSTVTSWFSIEKIE